MSPSAAIGIPPRMYKHFATLTIAITVMVAVFAEGDDARKAVEPMSGQIEQEIAQREEAARAQVRSTLERTPIDGGAMSVMPANNGDGGGFGADSAFGSPMERPGNGGGIIPARIAPNDVYSEEYLASLSEEERAALLAGLRDSGMLDAETKQQQIAALDRASAKRSGTSPGVH
jgi:hypothetical protein